MFNQTNAAKIKSRRESELKRMHTITSNFSQLFLVAIMKFQFRFFNSILLKSPCAYSLANKFKLFSMVFPFSSSKRYSQRNSIIFNSNEWQQQNIHVIMNFVFFLFSTFWNRFHYLHARAGENRGVYDVCMMCDCALVYSFNVTHTFRPYFIVILKQTNNANCINGSIYNQQISKVKC